MKKYTVNLYSYQLGELDCVKAICSTKEKAFEAMTTLFNMLLVWLPEEATDIRYTARDGSWRRFVCFTPKPDTTVRILQGLRVRKVCVEFYCAEFEEDALSSDDVSKERFFENVGEVIYSI